MRLVNWAILLFVVAILLWLFTHYYLYTYLVSVLWLIVFRTVWGIKNDK